MIKIIALGKIKEDYLRKGIDEYLKRISKYTKLEIIELKDLPLKDNMSEIELNKILEEEAKSIQDKINSNDFIIALDRNGIELSSIELSNKIDNIFNSYPNITFIIGSSYGLSKTILNKANLLLSFGKVTYPHQLFRLILLEQIYRSYKIINNETYNK